MGMYVMCQTHSGYKPLKFPRYRSGRTCRGQKWRFITLNHKWSVHDHPSLHSNGCHDKTFSFKASQRLWGCPTQHHPREPTQTRGPPVRECNGEAVRFVPCWCHSPCWQRPSEDKPKQMTSSPSLLASKVCQSRCRGANTAALRLHAHQQSTTHCSVGNAGSCSSFRPGARRRC